MSQDNVILLVWPDASKAYQAYSELKAFPGISGIAVVQRQADGQIAAKDGSANNVDAGTLGGGSIGALVGILGGPLGVLLGFAGGALVGSAFDLGRSADTSAALAQLSRALLPGMNGLVAEIVEDTPAAVDGYAAKTGATLLRRPTQEVMNELAAAEDAADAAAKEASKVLREQKKAERKDKVDAKVAEIKGKLSSAFAAKA